MLYWAGFESYWLFSIFRNRSNCSLSSSLWAAEGLCLVFSIACKLGSSSLESSVQMHSLIIKMKLFIVFFSFAKIYFKLYSIVWFHLEIIYCLWRILFLVYSSASPNIVNVFSSICDRKVKWRFKKWPSSFSNRLPSHVKICTQDFVGSNLKQSQPRSKFFS